MGKFDQELADAKNKYSEKEIVNGIEISVGWDSGHREYTLFFPGIDLDVAASRGISDQIIRITDNENDARDAFSRARNCASQSAFQKTDIYDLYLRVEKLVERFSRRSLG